MNEVLTAAAIMFGVAGFFGVVLSVANRYLKVDEDPRIDQVEQMLPDLIRRGRRPTVGINASRTTIILRVVADGDSEAECDAAIEPTVATAETNTTPPGSVSVSVTPSAVSGPRLSTVTV